MTCTENFEDSRRGVPSARLVGGYVGDRGASPDRVDNVTKFVTNRSKIASHSAHIPTPKGVNSVPGVAQLGGVRAEAPRGEGKAGARSNSKFLAARGAMLPPLPDTPIHNGSNNRRGGETNSRRCKVLVPNAPQV